MINDIAAYAQAIMPYLYTALWPTVLLIVVAKLVYEQLGIHEPRGVELGVRWVLVFVAGVTFLLSIATGTNPIVGLGTYRPVVVGIRIAMFSAAAAALYAAVVGLVAWWRNHRSVSAAGHHKRA